MAHVIALPLTTFRRPTISHVWPAEVVPVESLYLNAARVMRAWANSALARGEKERAATLRSRSRYYDLIGFSIQQKADALARAEARNATYSRDGQSNVRTQQI